MSVVNKLVEQMDANRIATRNIFGDKMSIAVLDAVAKMDAVTAAKTAANEAAVIADAAALATYTSEKEAAQELIASAISDLLENENVGTYVDDIKELKEAIEADQASATATLLEYVSSETDKTNQLIEDFGTLAQVEAEFAGFLGGADA